MKKLEKIIRQWLERPWVPPLVFLVLCFLSYGLVINQLGFYWDDWAKSLVYRIFGPEGYAAYYAEDRPISGWSQIAFISLFGDRPLYWQIFTLSLRWLTAVSIWWTLRVLWPGFRFLALLTAALFSVYPVFKQQAVAVTFHQQWLQYLFCFVSFGAMLLAWRKKRLFWPLTALSLLLMALELTITEYFIGVELLRPVMLWFMAGEQEKHFFPRLKRLMVSYAPYLALTAAYVIYRLFFIRLTGDDPYRANTLFEFFQAPWQVLSMYTGIVWRESLYMLVTHWYEALKPELFADDALPYMRLSWLAAFAAGAGLLFYLWAAPDQDGGEESDRGRVLRQALLLGLAGTLMGALPAWITGRLVIFDIHSDRYALPAMFGLSLLTVALLTWFASQRLQRAAAVCLLVALAVGANIRVSNDYRWEWTAQTRFFWQLYWRAPYLQPGTAVVLDKEAFPNNGLFSMSSALNFLYPQEKNPERLAYWMYALGRRYNANSLTDPEKMTFSTQFRSLKFKGAAPKSVLVYYNTAQATCLWVVTPEDVGDPALSPLLEVALPMSSQSNILPEPISTDYPDTSIFGPEPGHAWCYYYQKAALAQQSSDWQTIADLGDAAAALGYSPENSASNTPHEWRPFIEAYARLGRYDEAREITRQSALKGEKFNPWLCSIWDGIPAEAENEDNLMNARAEVFTSLGCKP